MKKFVFALEMMSLMLVLPVYMIVELNQPTTATEKVNYVTKKGRGDRKASQIYASPARVMLPVQ